MKTRRSAWLTSVAWSGGSVRRAGATVAITFGALVFSDLASAQVTAQDRALAQSMFDDARTLMDAGDYAHACPKLAESQRLDPAGGTLLNLGTCYEKAGRTAAAWAAYEEAVTFARRDNRPDRERFAQGKVDALKAILSSVTIRVAPEAQAAGLKVELDGRVIGQPMWGTAMPLDPGAHTLQVSAPGKTAQALSITLGASSDRQTVDVPVLANVGEPAPVASTSTSPGPSTIDKGVEAGSPVNDRTHAGRLGLFVRGDIEGQGRGAVGVPGLTYGLGDYVEVGAGALIGSHQGGWAGVNGFLLSGEWKPVVSVGAPVFFADGARIGVQGEAGVQWDPDRSYGTYLLVGATHFFSVPDGQESTVFVPVVGVQARL